MSRDESGRARLRRRMGGILAVLARGRVFYEEGPGAMVARAAYQGGDRCRRDPLVPLGSVSGVGCVKTRFGLLIAAASWLGYSGGWSQCWMRVSSSPRWRPVSPPSVLVGAIRAWLRIWWALTCPILGRERSRSTTLAEAANSGGLTIRGARSALPEARSSSVSLGRFGPRSRAQCFAALVERPARHVHSASGRGHSAILAAAAPPVSMSSNV